MSWNEIRAAWLSDSGDANAIPPNAMILAPVTGRNDHLVIAPVGDEGGVAAEWRTFTRRTAYPSVGEPNIGRIPFLLVVRVFASEPERDEFRRWLDQEHSARQLTIAGVRWYLGYEEEGDEHSFLNLWGIDDPDIVDGEAWSEVRDTPWWARVSHVTATADRGVYRLVGG